MTFTGLTEDICRRAWEIVEPSIAHAADMQVTKRWAGTIVVLVPNSSEVLFSASVNAEHQDAELFDEIAMAKAKVSWETGLPSRLVQQSAPHLYQPGWTKWGGSAAENGLVVAFSGVQAVFDEAISWSVLNWIVALCQHEMTREGGVMDTDGSYVG